MSKILYPSDFSAESRHALEHATVIATWFGARIPALYVIGSVPIRP